MCGGSVGTSAENGVGAGVGIGVVAAVAIGSSSGTNSSGYSMSRRGLVLVQGRYDKGTAGMLGCSAVTEVVFHHNETLENPSLRYQIQIAAAAGSVWGEV